jgi:hypothetical protein
MSLSYHPDATLNMVDKNKENLIYTYKQVK